MYTFEDTPADQLALIIAELLSSGRLQSPKIILDGMVIYDEDGQGQIDPDPSEYDALGFSLETSPVGAVRIKSVDEKIAEWAADKDPLKRKVAQKTSQWYLVNLQGIREYNIDQEWQWRNNVLNAFAFIWSQSAAAPVVEFDSAKYISETGERLEYTMRLEHLPVQQRRQFERNPVFAKTTVPNHSILLMGNDMSENHPGYDDYLKTVAQIALRGMETSLERERKIADNPYPGGGVDFSPIENDG